MIVQHPASTSGPNVIEATVRRAMALQQSGRLGEAEEVYKSVLATHPNNFESLHFLGLLEAQRDNFDKADRLMRRSLQVNGTVADAHANHARVLNALKRSDEALAACNRALALDPGSIEALVSGGNALSALNRYEEALDSFNQALAMRADYFAALTNRGSALVCLGQYDKALSSYDRALAIKPRDPGTLSDRGALLEQLGRFDAAIASYEAAIAAKPNLAQAAYRRAVLLGRMGRHNDAVAAYECARSIDAEHPAALDLLNLALGACEWPRVERLSAELKAKILAGKQCNSFAALFVFDDPFLHQKCAANLVSTIPAQPFERRPRGRRERIRLAYCSPDFRAHPVSFLIAELIERHDRERFEVLGFSFGQDDKTQMRQRMVGAFDRFYDMRAVASRDVALQLLDLEVDIAVDLACHTVDTRPEVFSFRAAPIQVNYLGYPGTFGAAYLDYVIADRIVLPFDQQPFYAEKIVHLPHCYQPHSNRAISAHVPTRQEVGLPDKGFVFCSFNNPQKMTAPVFDIWMRLLARIDGSVLWLLSRDALAEANLRREARDRGIDPARLIFAPKIAMHLIGDHLARHRLASLFLDTFPYNAHTTAQDALWAGLPVLTCQGRAFASRVAASLLHAIGLPELITTSFAEYEALALQLATDRALLAAIREKLARNRQTHPMFDTDLSRRHIEAAYKKMWQIWQRGESPQSFAVEAIEGV